MYFIKWYWGDEIVEEGPKTEPFGTPDSALGGEGKTRRINIR